MGGSNDADSATPDSADEMPLVWPSAIPMPEKMAMIIVLKIFAPAGGPREVICALLIVTPK